MDWKLRFGDLNPHLSVSVSAPPNVATIDMMPKAVVQVVPGACSQVHFGYIITLDRSYAWEDVYPRQGEAPRERSRDGENMKDKKGNTGNKGGPQGK